MAWSSVPAGRGGRAGGTLALLLCALCLACRCLLDGRRGTAFVPPAGPGRSGNVPTSPLTSPAWGVPGRGIEASGPPSSSSSVVGSAVVAAGALGLALAASSRLAPRGMRVDGSKVVMFMTKFGLKRMMIDRIRPGKRRIHHPNHYPLKYVPVLNMEGQQVGEEALSNRCFSKVTANYLVHRVFKVWMYMNVWNFMRWFPGRSDMKKGPKPYPQKGTGKSRQGSKYSIFFAKAYSSKWPRGLDDKFKKKIPRRTFMIALSTVLQSKWRAMRVIDGLEDWDECDGAQARLINCLHKWKGRVPGQVPQVIITRTCSGKMRTRRDASMPDRFEFEHPLYRAGRHVSLLHFYRPQDIEPSTDFILKLLKSRRIFISREAFYDLKAKFGEDGWAFKTEDDILQEQWQELAKEYPFDRKKEIDAARVLPVGKTEFDSLNARTDWAAEVRQEMADAEAA